MKKIFYLILTLFLISFSLNASKYNSDDIIKMVTTEHFDIIYNDESSLLASEIKDICEETYSDICKTYNIEEGKRFPVVVSSDMEQFNSYFQYTNPESIVMFDTISTNDFFNIFGSNNMANVFRHELTHALTLTRANSLTRKVFGVDYASLNGTSFQKEGVAVYYESTKGEGRLNDPLESSKLIEAKAENSFANYQEANVARILHTNGNYYLYGSSFYEYLINTYGIEMFNEYYKKITDFNVFFLLPEITFNSIYPKNLIDVWNDFQDSIPDVDIDSSLEIEELSDISSLSLIDGGDDIYVLNPRFSNVSKLNIDNGELDDILFVSQKTKDVNCNDGVITISSMNMPNDFRNPNTTYTTVYKAGVSTDYNISSFRNSIYIDNNIVGIKNEGEIQYLQWIDMKGNVVKNYYLPKNESIQRLTIDDDKNIIFTSRYLDNCIISRLKGQKREIVKLEKGIAIQGLSTYRNKVVLSTVKKGELPKFTVVDFENSTKKTMNETILGGVYSPIVTDDNTMIFLRRFYSGQSLSKMDINQLTFNTRAIKVTTMDYDKKPDNIVVNIEGEKEYNPIKYLSNSLKPTLSVLVFEEFFVENSFSLYCANTDPTGQFAKAASVTLEYSKNEKALITRDSYTYSKDDTKYNLKVDSKIKYLGDFDFSTGVEGQFELTTKKDLKLNNSINYGLNIDVDFSNGNYYTTYYKASSNKDKNGNYYIAFLNSNENKLGVSSYANWSFNKSCGRNDLNYFLISTGLSTSYNYYINKYYFYNFIDNIVGEKKASNVININSALSMHFPYLIPGKDNRVFSFDLPTSIDASVSYNLFDNYVSYRLNSTITLFSYNLDKAYFNHVPLYFRKFNIELFYNQFAMIGFDKINNQFINRNLMQNIGMDLYFSLSPTSSVFSVTTGINVGARLLYNLDNRQPSITYLLKSQML